MIQSYVSPECSYLPLLSRYDGVKCELSLTAAQTHSTPCYLKEINSPPLLHSFLHSVRLDQRQLADIRIHMKSLLSWLCISKSEISNLCVFRLLANLIYNSLWENICGVAVYLGCQDIEVAGAICPTNEFTSVICAHSGVLGYPHH